jgi:hypothetical protein
MHLMSARNRNHGCWATVKLLPMTPFCPVPQVKGAASRDQNIQAEFMRRVFVDYVGGQVSNKISAVS